MFGPIQHVGTAEEDGGARCAASALLGIPAAGFLLQESVLESLNKPLRSMAQSCHSQVAVGTQPT